MPTAIPSMRQLEFQDWEFGVFVHFLPGIYRKTAPAEIADQPVTRLLNPTHLSCDQWAWLAATSGAKYMVFTTKHHDGFCMWPSAITPYYSLKGSQWAEGKGDIVGEYVDACRRHGLKVGFYYSPFDHHVEYYKSEPTKYDEYFLAHMRELLDGKYGNIDILWFDGAFSEGHPYHWPMLIREIRRMQPEILIFGMGDPDFRWIGNEAGIAPSPCWNTVTKLTHFTGFTEDKELQTPKWLPGECDARIRYKGWSWKGPDDPLKSVEELMGLYYYSVGRGCNLLLNVGPDQRGLVNEEDAYRLLEFGAEIRRRFAKPILTLNQFTRSGTTWDFASDQPIILDHMIVMENISRGEHVHRFRLSSIPAPGEGAYISLYEGTSIGHKAICRFPTQKINKLRFEILEQEGEVELRSLEFFYVAGAS